MPATPHTEHHFTAPESVRDVVIGMSDGLTVPFALAAGISGALANNPHASSLVVTAGLAEIAAGSIAMGLGGYFAAKTDMEHYTSEREREVREIVELRDVEIDEVAKVFRDYGLTDAEMAPAVKAIIGNEKSWVDFMMRFELGPGRASAGARPNQRVDHRGFVHRRRTDSSCALHPAQRRAKRAMVFGGIHAAALAVFGWVKGRFTGIHPLKGGLQTVVTGGLAAGAAFLIAKLIS